MLVEVGQVVEGRVSGITNFGAFIQLPNGKTGLVHISEVAEEYVKDIKNHLKQDQKVKVRVLSVDDKGRISLSIKKASEINEDKLKRSTEPEWGRRKTDNMSFEERLAKFLKDSDERMQDLKKNFESKRGNGSYKR